MDIASKPFEQDIHCDHSGFNKFVHFFTEITVPETLVLENKIKRSSLSKT